MLRFKFPTPMPQFWHGLEIGKGTLRSWIEYFIEALILQIRGDRTPERQFLISLNCVFDASLVPETWRDWFVDSTGVMCQVPGEGRWGSKATTLGVLRTYKE